MFNYIKDKDLLEISVVPYEHKEVNYGKSPMYVSYEKYINETAVNDVKEIFLPELQAILDGLNVPAVISNPEIVVKFDPNSTYQGHLYNSVFIKFNYTAKGNDKDMRPFCLFKIPFMNEMGIVQREGSNYALLGELTQDNEVSFERKKGMASELKLITKAAYIALEQKGASAPILRMQKKRYPLETLIVALAVDAGLEPKSILEKLHIEKFANLCKSTARLSQISTYEIYMAPIREAMEIIKSPKFDLTDSRVNLNEILKLDRALGEVLADKVELKNGKSYGIGTVITEPILEELRANFVNEIYVRNIPNKVGQYLDEEIRLTRINAGTELIDIVRDQLPPIRGRYVDRVYTDVNIIIPSDTQVVPGLLELLEYNGIRKVRLKQSLTSSTNDTVYFSSEIVTNRQYLKKEINPDCSPEEALDWYLMEEDGSFVPTPSSLTVYDLMALTSIMYRLSVGKDTDYVVNRDLGLRKTVKLANELFHECFEKSVPQTMRKLKNKLTGMLNSDITLFNIPDVMENVFYRLSDDWWSALNQKRVVSMLDTTNPVALHSSLNKIVSLIADSNAVSDSMRSMSLGHYGRICPYETPQSKKLGVVNERAMGCDISGGIMRTAYHRVKHLPDGTIIIDKEKHLLTVQEEETEIIADLLSLDLEMMKDGNMKVKNSGRVLARVPAAGLEKMGVEYVDVKYVTLVNTDPNQQLGCVAATIPWIGSDDATRVSFETSMVKQSKTLLNADVPTIVTSVHVNMPKEDTYYQILAEDDGEVMDATDDSVVILYDTLTNQSGLTDREYKFQPSEFTADTVVIRHCVVEAGQRVHKGDVLVTSNMVKDGMLAMGKNMLVAYIPTGFNYEDGAHASVRSQAMFTSYGPHVVEDPYSRKIASQTIMGVRKSTYLAPGDDICTVDVKTGRKNRYNSVYRHDKIKGFMIQIHDGEIRSGVRKGRAITAKSISFDMFKSGDKLANRHGNKGVAPRQQRNDQMPLLRNGEIIDIVYNSTGVTGRMNIGQIKECNCGLAAYVLRIRVRSDSFNGATDKDISLLLSYAWDLANEDDTEAVIKRYPMLPEDLHSHSRENINYIRNWKGCFNKDGTARLYNPITNKDFGNDVVIGINTVYKLIHESAKKVHARAGYIDGKSRYKQIQDAPPKGAANVGGQRVGTMEVDALLAHGASSYVHELQNERGDNGVARSNFTVGRVHRGDRYMVDDAYAVRRSTQYFMQVMSSLGLEVDFESEDGDKENRIPSLSPEDNDGRRVCKPRAILLATETVKDDSRDDDPFAMFESQI